MLASEVAKSEEANRFLLSHKTTTLSVSESPLSLGLTTADIIGETCTTVQLLAIQYTVKPLRRY